MLDEVTPSLIQSGSLCAVGLVPQVRKVFSQQQHSSALIYLLPLLSCLSRSSLLLLACSYSPVPGCQHGVIQHWAAASPSRCAFQPRESLGGVSHM